MHGERDDGAPDWEKILRRAANDPNPHIPPKDEQDQDFNRIAELILRYAGVPPVELAWAKHFRRRREHDKAAREAIAERVRRKWGSDPELVSAFFSDCRLLARIAWSHDPAKLKEAVAEINSALTDLEGAKRRSMNQYTREAIDRATAVLRAHSEPMSAHLADIGYHRTTKNWVAYKLAEMASKIFERWIGGEIHARRDKATPEAALPGAGFPSFVRDLFERLDIKAHWARPVAAAVKSHRRSNATR